jgi:hypothetical protein
MKRFAILALMITAAIVCAQEEEEEEFVHEGEEAQEQFAGPMVYATGLLPDHRDLKVNLGGPVPVLMGNR